MTREESRNGKSQQSGSVRKEKMASSALLAAVLILSSSLGVTAAQVNQPKETVKTNPPVSQKPVSKGIVRDNPFAPNASVKTPTNQPQGQKTN